MSKMFRGLCGRRLGCASLAAIALVSFAPQVISGQVPDSASALLEPLGMPPIDATFVTGQQPLVWKLPSSNPQIVALAAALPASVTPEAFNSGFLTLEPVTSGDPWGRLSSPPTPNDFSALRVMPSDAADLANCKPGSCRVKLPSAWMHRLVQVTSNPDSTFREFLAAYGQLFEQGNAAALPPFDDRFEPATVAQGLALLAPFVELVHEPLPTAHDTASVLYWHGENLRGRTVQSLDALTVTRPSRGAIRASVAVVRFYSSHYFLAGVDLYLLVDDPAVAPKQLVVQLKLLALDTPVGRLERGSLESAIRALVSAGLARTVESLATR